MTHILLADDDVELCELITEYLQAEGFQITAVNDGEEALKTVKDTAFDLIILDVMLPKLTGFEVLAKLREHYKIPVLMLTARGSDVDRIVGLEMGADDYLPKPCNPRELVARIRAILRRTRDTTPVSVSDSEALTVGDLTLHIGKHQTLLNGQEIILTSTEFSVLAVLLAQAGKVVNKEQLNEKALGRKLTAYDRSMDMHVSNLRKKLGPHSNGKARIKTIRGMGYQYILPA
jgi:two-component system response regulator CpxR